MVFYQKSTSLCQKLQHENVGLEIKSGRLYMIQINNNQTLTVPVFMRVYRNRFEHYAVVSRDQHSTNHSVYLRLRHCQIQKSDSNEIKVMPDNIEGNKLTFIVRNKSEVDDWTHSLSSSTSLTDKSKTSKPQLRFRRFSDIPRTSFMPSLKEED